MGVGAAVGVGTLRGGWEFLELEIKNQVSKFQTFKFPKFQSPKVPKFKVSKFQRLKPNLMFSIDIDPAFETFKRLLDRSSGLSRPRLFQRFQSFGVLDLAISPNHKFKNDLRFFLYYLE